MYGTGLALYGYLTQLYVTLWEHLMNTYKSLGLVGLAVASLFAAQAFATTTCPTGTQGSPVCIATTGGDGAGSSLQQQFNDITTHPGGINVYTGQANPSAYWSIGGSGASENAIVMELAGNANGNTFGIFDPTNPGTTLQLFTGPATTGYTATLYNDGNGKFTANQLDPSHHVVNSYNATFGAGNTFGYYLETPTGTFFFSDPSLNGGHPQMVAFAGNGSTSITFAGHTGRFNPGEYLLAWEDTSLASSDRDYNDFVVLVESVHPVPEPAALGMFGLGVLLIGGFTVLRRRQYNA